MMTHYLQAFVFAFFATVAFGVLFQGPKRILWRSGLIGALGWVVFIALIATEERADGASRHDDRDVAIDGAQATSAVYGKILLCFGAVEGKQHFTILVGLVATLEEVVDNQFATRTYCFKVLLNVDAVALSVGASKAPTHTATLDLAIGVMNIRIRTDVGR